MTCEMSLAPLPNYSRTIEAYRRILKAAETGKGVRLSRDECASHFQRRSAISTAVQTHDMDVRVADACETREFQPAVIELAEWLGYRVYHVAKVKGQLRSRTGVGFFDLVMMRDGRIILPEFKSEKGKLSDDQEAWAAEGKAAAAANPKVEYYLWRPTDWLDGTIERTLKR